MYRLQAEGDVHVSMLLEGVGCGVRATPQI